MPVLTIRKERANNDEILAEPETISLAGERSRYLRTRSGAAITHVDIFDSTNSKLFYRTTEERSRERTRGRESKKRGTRDTTGSTLLKIPPAMVHDISLDNSADNDTARRANSERSMRK